MKKEKLKRKSFKLDEQAVKILEQMSKKLGITQTAIIRLSIREYHKIVNPIKTRDKHPENLD